jgi:acyl carrier protein
MPAPTAISPAAMIELVRENVLPDLPADFGAEGDFFEAGLDSMGVMQLVMYLEERFGKKVEPTELSRANFRSGQAMAALVRGQGAAA